MTQIGRAHEFTARDVRALMCGQGDPDVVVLRQAFRIRPDDSDELLVVRRGGDFWVSRRMSDRIEIWACIDDVDADEHLDRLAPAADGWVEARPVEQAG